MGEKELAPHELGDFSGYGDDPRLHKNVSGYDAAPGTEATHPYGVLYQGAWETLADGTCVAVRRHAKALAQSGLPVLLKSFSGTYVNEYGCVEPAGGNIMRQVLDERIKHFIDADGKTSAITQGEGKVTDVDGKRVLDDARKLAASSISQLVPRIYHMVIRDADHLRGCIVPRYVSYETLDAKTALEAVAALYATSIVFSVWEREKVPGPVVKQLSRCAMVWVPCEQNRHALVQSGVPESKVHVLGHPYDPGSAICRLTERAVRPGRRFYSIGAWQPRKGFHELIGAFLLAFAPRDDASLTIKYGGGKWEKYPSPRTSVAYWLDQEPIKKMGWSMEKLRGKLQLWEGRVSRDRILKFHFDHNIYVSASHGEAWCLPAFDAVTAGNALVHVPYGGTADFEPPGSERVPYELSPVHSSYGWGPDARWAGYDIGELAAALKRTRPPGEHARTEAFEKSFSMEAVGARMRELVLQVAKAQPEVYLYLKGRL